MIKLTTNNIYHWSGGERKQVFKDGDEDDSDQVSKRLRQLESLDQTDSTQ